MQEAEGVCHVDVAPARVTALAQHSTAQGSTAPAGCNACTRPASCQSAAPPFAPPDRALPPPISSACESRAPPHLLRL